MGVLAFFARVAADWDWAVAVGDHILRTGSIPDHVPFAKAPTQGWHDVPVLAQLTAAALDKGGPGLVVGVHLFVVVLALMLLLGTAGASQRVDGRSALLLPVFVSGTLPVLALVRLQTFSVVFFAALLALIVAQDRKPDRNIWWAPVLVGVWGNFHGGVLLGVCVLGAYLVFGRLRRSPRDSILVGVASVAALLATSQGWHTVSYYRSVMVNRAAARGEGLWAPISLSQPFDVLMLVSIGVLGAVVVRSRPRLWEVVALGGLGVATLSASRHGVWLLCLLFVLALRGRRHASVPSPVATGSGWVGPSAGVVLSMALATAVVLSRADSVGGADPQLVASVMAAADDGVVLAPATLAERLAAEGATVWIGNPLDAFAPEDQDAYLDFLAGQPGMQPAVAGSDLVVTEDGTAAGKEMAVTAGWVADDCFPGWTCYRRS